METPSFVVAVFLVVLIWVPWYHQAALVNPLGLPFRMRYCVFLLPVCCPALNLIVLLTLSAQDVQRDPLYIGFYLIVAAGWIGAMTLVFPCFGLSLRDDVLERGNPAALMALSGAVIGATCSFAGANVGDGPGVEAVVLSALLSSAVFFACWFAVERILSASEAITVDRNVAFATRFAGFLIALGLLAGWSVAGNWESFEGTLRDLAFSLPPVLALNVAMISAEVFCKKITVKRSFELKASRTLALFYVFGAAVWICIRGAHS